MILHPCFIDGFSFSRLSRQAGQRLLATYADLNLFWECSFLVPIIREIFLGIPLGIAPALLHYHTPGTQTSWRTPAAWGSTSLSKACVQQRPVSTTDKLSAFAYLTFTHWGLRSL